MPHYTSDDKLGSGLPRVERIQCGGAYPFARLNYVDPGLPVKVRLEAFSPIVPGDSRLSAMPAAPFVFHVTNTNPLAPSDVAIMATARNLVGSWNVGRFNQAAVRSDMAGVLFCVDSPSPATRGQAPYALRQPEQPAGSAASWHGT